MTKIIGGPSDKPRSLLASLDALGVLQAAHETWRREHPGSLVAEVEGHPGVRALGEEEHAFLHGALPLAFNAYVHETEEGSVEHGRGGELADALSKQGLRLVFHEDLTVPGERTSYYLAYDAAARRAILGVKGTDSIGDYLTDAVCASVPLPQREAPADGATADASAATWIAHEGVLACTRALLDDVGPMLSELFGGFELLLTGHSLGGGVACLAAILLTEAAEYRRFGEPFVGALRAVGFATPPVVDRATALRCSSYVWTVVNNNDFVPRMSVRNLATLLHTLDETIALTRSEGAAAVQANVGDTMRRAEEQSVERLESDLYCPGTVLWAYRDGDGAYHSAVHDGTLTFLSQVVPSNLVDHEKEPYFEAMVAVAPGGAASRAAMPPTHCTAAEKAIDFI